MKKIYLQKIHQHSEVSYIGKIDPRDLVKVATKVEMSDIQDAQRPLNKKRVKDIAKYVAETEGILPSTLVVGTNDNSFDIKHDNQTNLYYLDFPETDIEYANYKNKIDVMDGQHRLYSFLDDICILPKDVKYEIGFTLYDKPGLNARRKIFISCNEKQEKVSGNLLMWFKAKLQMLSEEERNFYNVVQQLNECYPLKGHIIMSAEPIKNGVKAKEVMATLKQAKVHDLLINGQPLTDEQKVKAITTYLISWEKFAGFSFTTSKLKVAGPAIKMAGLKFMLLVFPKVWERALATRSAFDEQFIIDTLSQLSTILCVERAEFFTCETNKFKFRDRTVIDEFANTCNKIISSLDAGDFNPLG